MGLAAAALMAAPAFATGQVYGNYGQGQPYQGGPYQGQPNYSNCDTDVAVGTGLGMIVGGIIGNQFG